MPFFALLSALALTGTPGKGQGSVSLRFHPPVGRSYHYLMYMSMAMDHVEGMPSMNFKMDLGMQMKALSKTGDVTSMEYRVTSVKVTAPSDSPMASMQQTMQKQLSGKVFKGNIDSLYHVSGMSGSGMDSMINSMSSNISYPNHPVKVGESWTTSLDMGKAMGAMGGGMGLSAGTSKIPVTFRLVKISNQGGKTVAAVRVSMNGVMNLGGAQAMKMNLDSSGTINIDVANGMTLNQMMTSTIGMNVAGKHLVQHMNQALSQQ
jgi:hypothetical protein